MKVTPGQRIMANYEHILVRDWNVYASPRCKHFAKQIDAAISKAVRIDRNRYHRICASARDFVAALDAVKSKRKGRS